MTYSSNGQNKLISAVPDGTACYKNNLLGSCSSGSCQVNNQDPKAVSPTAAPQAGSGTSAGSVPTQHDNPSNAPSIVKKQGKRGHRG